MLDVEIHIAILAAGSSTRLGLLGKFFPKALLPIPEGTSLDAQISIFENIEPSSIHILVSNHFDCFEQYFSHCHRDSDRVFLSKQPMLGTGGALCCFLTSSQFNDDSVIVVSNADTIIKMDSFGDVMQEAIYLLDSYPTDVVVMCTDYSVFGREHNFYYNSDGLIRPVSVSGWGVGCGRTGNGCLAQSTGIIIARCITLTTALAQFFSEDFPFRMEDDCFSYLSAADRLRSIQTHFPVHDIGDIESYFNYIRTYAKLRS